MMWLPGSAKKKFTDTTHTEKKKFCQRLARPKKTGEIEIYNPDLILIKSDCLASRSVTRLVLITNDNNRPDVSDYGYTSARYAMSERDWFIA